MKRAAFALLPIIIGSGVEPTPPGPNKIPGYQFTEDPGGGD